MLRRLNPYVPRRVGVGDEAAGRWSYTLGDAAAEPAVHLCWRSPSRQQPLLREGLLVPDKGATPGWARLPPPLVLA